jgi:hypothetical protein
VWRWLSRRSTGEILVLLVASTICVGLAVSGAALILFEFIHPSADASAAAKVLAGTVNTLIGLLAGFLAGRSDAEKPPPPPPPKEPDAPPE